MGLQMMFVDRSGDKWATINNCSNDHAWNYHGMRYDGGGEDGQGIDGSRPPLGAMMTYKFDFSLFCSPTQSYGCVTGYVETPSPAAPGAMIDLLDESAAGAGLALRIESILPPGEDYIATLMLEDHLAEGRLSAEALAGRLEAQGRYFVDVY